MKNLYRIVALILLCTHLASAQYFDMPGLKCAEGKHQISSESLAKRNLRYPGDATVDVSYYFLNLAIRPDTKFLKGQVQIDLHALKAGITSFFLDLNNSFKVDSVVVNAKKVAFSHSSNKLTVTLNTPAISGELLSTKVFYGGIPVQNSNSYSIEFTFHNGQPVIWTLSEPYDAPTWFPCVDNQADKADSCDVWITLPSYYTAVSQGVLQEVTNNSDGTNTAKWKHRYPIAHYLISIAASNYTKQERYYKHSETDSMQVVDYLYPETAANPSLAPLLDRTVDMLELFSEKYGEYPFIKEKYGHAMFGFGGGMEHQTVSSMGGFTFDLIAHELAHQWFGDKVTCKTWRDIWINEGFAEFSALYAGEVLLGKARYMTDIANYMKEAKLVSGTVAIANTNSVNAIFDYRKTYVKGSLILHMLRGVLGDDLFFKVLKEFQTTEFAYDAASIEDFQGVAERVTGQSLAWFFDEWLFGEGYPKYSFGWKESASGKLLVQIANAGSSEKTPFFKMPVLLRVKYSSGNTEDIVVFADCPQVLITLDLKESGVADVAFDPENQILKDLKLTEAPDEILGTAGTDLAIFPNPVSHFLNVSLRSKPEVYNSSGKSFPVDWTEEGIHVKYLPAGRYFIRNNQLVSSFIKL